MEQFKNQLKIEVTPNGLQVQILDDRKRPMFGSGVDLPKDYAAKILKEVAVFWPKRITESVLRAIPIPQGIIRMPSIPTGNCRRIVQTPPETIAGWRRGIEQSCPGGRAVGYGAI